MSISYEIDKHGYTVEKTVETLPGGGQSIIRVTLRAEQLVTVAAIEEDGKLPGGVIDNQERVHQAALKLQAAGSSKGHLEAQEWYLRHAEEIETLIEAINTAHVRELQAEGGMSCADIAAKLKLAETEVSRILQGKKKLRISDFREEPAAQTEGFHDATPDAKTRAFEATTKAIIASVERMGKHEGTETKDQKGWTPLAKKIARRANAKMLKKFEPIEVEDEAGQLDTSEKVKKALKKALSEKAELPCVSIDLDGLADELKLDPDLRAYLHHYGEASRAQMAALLTRETGETWDSKRVDRVRKRFEYHLPEIKAAAPKHRFTEKWATSTPNAILLKTALNPSGYAGDTQAWVYALLRHVFSD
jgi:predicted transcriptional regulator